MLSNRFAKSAETTLEFLNLTPQLNRVHPHFRSAFFAYDKTENGWTNVRIFSRTSFRYFHHLAKESARAAAHEGQFFPSFHWKDMSLPPHGIVNHREFLCDASKHLILLPHIKKQQFFFFYDIHKKNW